jgi:hypothetical protein
MIRPTQIYFGPDGGFSAENAPSKVYLRAMMYATGKRGWIIENMFARVQRGETRQTFNIWVHGSKDVLQQGAGLFVPESGIISNHHFVAPPNVSFEFISGGYVVDIFTTE